MADPYRPIGDYGLIGDCRSCALVSRRGSIDWLCAPRFDAPSVFNALLDHWRGGRFAVTPIGPFSAARRYVPETAVLETEFRCAEGRAVLVDFAPALREDEKRGRLLPLWSVLRRVTVLEGRVSFEVFFKPRPDEGRLAPRLERAGRAIVCRYGASSLLLTCDGTLELARGEAWGIWTLAAGETRTLWLSYDETGPAVLPALAQAPELLTATLRYWRRWSARCSYAGPRRASVLRSALTLKLLSYAPSGAITAAPTTSLPEAIGSSRNWDYRYCWLRDASLTARVFAELGYSAESQAFVEWMIYATARTHPVLKVFYDLFGEHSHREREVPALEGYRHSGPVRDGNDAEGQYQLDVYGETLLSLRRHVEKGGRVDNDMRRLILEIGDYVAGAWSLPDHGIWEMRLPRRHFVNSKVMCWLALEHAKALAERLRLPADFARWHGAQTAIRGAVETHGWSSSKRSFTQAFGSQTLDATALLVPIVGFLAPEDPRGASTIAAVRAELARGELVYRYRRDDGLPGDEGAFVACGYWLVGALAKTGRVGEALELFERLEGRRSDLGLWSEEIDPASGQLLGNFPQAFAHMTHVRAALLLEASLHDGRARVRSAPARRGALRRSRGRRERRAASGGRS